MGEIDGAQLTEAVLIWTGYKKSTRPLRDNALVLQRFGPEAGAHLLAAVLHLKDEFYQSDARHVAADLPEMARLSVEQFRRKHPEVAEEIAQAFAWCYTFDFK
ncbi:MAG TPA: hypothetical protein VHW09_15345 [Bryobacteraceae bacterium]|jgi:hypothetical protein|nr:hypothetical protein [Bryobacteraceae bacterium]